MKQKKLKYPTMSNTNERIKNWAAAWLEKMSIVLFSMTCSVVLHGLSG
ncbi:hypothetical protein DESPIG_00969 [Desulfovibrio piger ATCC 29098]|uniref:Uncharacterized protein n=1 Tax=Desulfovibrio piger ATCC 29098 TaxID=411464 RepID=B6WSI0_9BACT|nr:hypothetical protein DESPIG_00969 [Desulfovibrio piger ATCC 29098]